MPIRYRIASRELVDTVPVSKCLHSRIISVLVSDTRNTISRKDMIVEAPLLYRKCSPLGVW